MSDDEKKTKKKTTTTRNTTIFDWWKVVLSLLNFYLKIISKSLTTRVKNVLANLIDARQIA